MADKFFYKSFYRLRSRILNSLIFIFITFIISYIFAEQIYNFLTDPMLVIKDDKISRRLIFTALHETFITYIKIAFFTAIFRKSGIVNTNI